MKARPRQSVLSLVVIPLTFLLIGTVPDWSVGAAAGPNVGPRAAGSGGYWFKGNTHVHSSGSPDGDSTPGELARWYREHGYDFVVITDHNALTPVPARERSDHFLVMQGEEVTEPFQDQPIHVNALGITAPIAPQGGTNVADVVRRDTSAVRSAGGVAVVNHPNYIAQMGADVLSSLETGSLFEVFNVQPETRSLGAPGVASMEATWDAVLSRGKLLYGVAVDDGHTLKSWHNLGAHRPGGGWVVVHAASLNAPNILQALARGDFYASTGVELDDYAVTDTGISLDIHEVPSRSYRIQFIGRDGRILDQTSGTSASYMFCEEDDLYVRARIEDSTGAVAWTQPVFPKHRR